MGRRMYRDMWSMTRREITLRFIAWLVWLGLLVAVLIFSKW
jgi:hypothetical protein